MSIFTHDLSALNPAAKAALARPASVYIDGAFHRTEATLPVHDPATGDQIAEIAAGGAAEIDGAVQAARRALVSGEWAKMGPQSRERLLHRLAALIEQRVDALAQVETIDNGMPSWFAYGPAILGATDVYRYYAGWPTKLSGHTLDVEAPPGMGDFVGFTRREPVGVIAAIIPWNVPFMMATFKLAPALAAGCTVVLKPAEDTSLTALMLAELVEEAGFPKGVVNIVTGRGPEAGEALLQHPGIDKISFTGSTKTGRHIGEVAGRNLKRHTLELGGKSPVLLFADADLDEAVPGAATSILMNSGQICVAGSRLYVQDKVFDDVVDRLQRHVAGVSIGAGLTPDVFMGPLVNAAQKARVTGYIDGAGRSGLEVFRGRPVEEGRGHYVSPAIVVGASADHEITREEIFGPVLSVYRFNDEEEAFALANGTDYGLASTIWSRDISRVMRGVSALRCGKVIVNNSGFPYPALPEGGVKASGHGRDLGQEAIEACLTTKSVLMKL